MFYGYFLVFVCLVPLPQVYKGHILKTNNSKDEYNAIMLI